MTEPDPRVVEKVARAICAVPWSDQGDDEEDSARILENAWRQHKDDWMAYARAAILAMQDGPLPVVEFPRK